MSGIPQTASKRLKRDYIRIKNDPVPFIQAEPLPNNILEWHYVVIGPPDSLYRDGYYHGKLVFPKEFPFKPPQILMITPNGRFQTNTRLCLSISDYHPDTWNPAWSVSTILTGLLSFMLETGKTMGSIESSNFMKSQFAEMSISFNLENKTFVELFPELSEEMRTVVLKQELSKDKKTDISQDSNSAIGIVSNSVLGNLILVVALVLFTVSARHIILGAIDD